MVLDRLKAGKPPSRVPTVKHCIVIGQPIPAVLTNEQAAGEIAPKAAPKIRSSSTPARGFCSRLDSLLNRVRDRSASEVSNTV